MCDERACAGSCVRFVSPVTAAAGLVAAAAAGPVLRGVLPAVEAGVRWFLVAVAVAVAAAVGAGVALSVLRWRRGRRVVTGRVVRGVVWRAAVPAAGVPLAIASGVPVFAPVALLVGALVVFEAVRYVAAQPQVVFVHPALLAARRAELPAAVPLPAGPVVAGEVVREA
jgi:hypothetical protein